MTGWLILIYLVGLVITARKATLAELNAGIFAPIEARAFGFAIGLCWPFMLLALLITGGLPKTDVQLRADLAARDRRIAELQAALRARP
ncbi:hypothetical protein GCM10022252_76410 [Streptosporangium oxazolinicum]|uniref:Uncharacterized protein n=1 Tax=Streptosporangium oxazolinicum TaxID=909287 RepID=A0ABP8BLQ5_9ACTN